MASRRLVQEMPEWILPVPKEAHANATLMWRAPILQNMELGVEPLCGVVHEAVFLLFLPCHAILPCGRISMMVGVERRSRLSDMSLSGFFVSPFWSRRVLLKGISQLSTVTVHFFASQSSCSLDEVLLLENSKPEDAARYQICLNP